MEHLLHRLYGVDAPACTSSPTPANHSHVHLSIMYMYMQLSSHCQTHHAGKHFVSLFSQRKQVNQINWHEYPQYSLCADSENF